MNFYIFIIHKFNEFKFTIKAKKINIIVSNMKICLKC